MRSSASRYQRGASSGASSARARSPARCAATTSPCPCPAGWLPAPSGTRAVRSGRRDRRRRSLRSPPPPPDGRGPADPTRYRRRADGADQRVREGVAARHGRSGEHGCVGGHVTESDDDLFFVEPGDPREHLCIEVTADDRGLGQRIPVSGCRGAHASCPITSRMLIGRPDVRRSWLAPSSSRKVRLATAPLSTPGVLHTSTPFVVA